MTTARIRWHAPGLGLRSDRRQQRGVEGVERFVQAIQQECLDKFVVFGREHLDHVAAEYVEHYHAERPHQGMGNRPLLDDGREPSAEGEVACRERLGGVLRHYYRDAA